MSNTGAITANLKEILWESKVKIRSKSGERQMQKNGAKSGASKNVALTQQLISHTVSTCQYCLITGRNNTYPKQQGGGDKGQKANKKKRQ